MHSVNAEMLRSKSLFSTVKAFLPLNTKLWEKPIDYMVFTPVWAKGQRGQPVPQKGQIQHLLCSSGWESRGQWQPTLGAYFLIKKLLCTYYKSLQGGKKSTTKKKKIKNLWEVNRARWGEMPPPTHTHTNTPFRFRFSFSFYTSRYYLVFLFSAAVSCAE